MQSAQNAARSIGDDFPVEVIDSRSITSGLGTIVLEAARLAETGADAGAVRKLVDDLIPRTRVFGALHTLENLKKGGRIGGARAMLGSMLSIKPIIDISTGVVEEAAKARTRTKSLVWLYDRMKADGAIEHVAIHHGDAQDIEDFLTLISPDFPRERIRLGKIGAVIGTHGGPEIIGATWVTPPD
jgi:DegV family protein with EDD domain